MDATDHDARDEQASRSLGLRGSMETSSDLHNTDTNIDYSDIDYGADYPDPSYDLNFLEWPMGDSGNNIQVSQTSTYKHRKSKLDNKTLAQHVTHNLNLLCKAQT